MGKVGKERLHEHEMRSSKLTRPLRHSISLVGFSLPVRAVLISANGSRVNMDLFVTIVGWELTILRNTSKRSKVKIAS